jgi:hypothetical protein
MAKFERGLRAGVVEYLQSRPGWWRDLIDCKFSVHDRSEQRLLIALRGGYLNAYVEGQSVLKLGFERKPIAPHGRIHRKYVDEDFQGQEYLYFDGESVRDKAGKLLCRYEGMKTLDAWVGRAKAFGKDEKRGVAAIAARNPNVIDVEMALPAESGPSAIVNGKPTAKVAPRMDIVALESDEADRPRIAFYEAKLLSNPELRAVDQPKIFDQLKIYETYVTQPKRREQIIEAYRQTSIFLRELGEMRGISVNSIVEQATVRGNLDLDPKPRVIVFEYDPSRVGEGSSWEKHGAKLSSEATLIMEPNAANVRLPS